MISNSSNPSRGCLCYTHYTDVETCHHPKAEQRRSQKSKDGGLAPESGSSAPREEETRTEGVPRREANFHLGKTSSVSWQRKHLVCSVKELEGEEKVEKWWN